MFIKEEIMAQSSYHKHVLAQGFEKGKEEGKEEGREEGKAEGMMEVLLDLLAFRYPGLESVPELKGFASRGLTAVESLHKALKAAPDKASARRAIAAAARIRA